MQWKPQTHFLPGPLCLLQEVVAVPLPHAASPGELLARCSLMLVLQNQSWHNHKGGWGLMSLLLTSGLNWGEGVVRVEDSG